MKSSEFIKEEFTGQASPVPNKKKQKPVQKKTIKVVRALRNSKPPA